MKKKVILLTGSELRHDFFRKFIANDKEIEVLATYCESQKGNLQEMVKREEGSNSLRVNHLDARSTTEFDFFGIYCDAVEDKSHPIFIEKGEINEQEHVKRILDLNPDILISYGCSIIRSELLTVFAGRFVNIHLGLSPYYRGSGTNFWPFVNNELQCIGTTFMYIDEGIDTGEIIHQIRAEINFNDNIHQIGNRLIRNSISECKKLIKSFKKLKRVPPLSFDKHNERYYRKKDFTEDALKIAYNNLYNRSVDKYLENKALLDLQFPIIENPTILSS